jgi:TRAP-type C4-dicarboxylate transport system substrate-binding protein
MTRNNPIRTVDALRGLKIRMQPNEPHRATFRAIGANPVAMDIRELSSAVQQGVVDGRENPEQPVGFPAGPERASVGCKTASIPFKRD